jgi:hypothetical protein
MVETTGISTQSLTIRKKECEYFLFDFIPRDLTSRDLQQVRAKRNGKDMAANVANTHKEGRNFTQRYATGVQ